MTTAPWLWTHLCFALLAMGFSGLKSFRAVGLVGLAAFFVSLIPCGEVDLNGRVIPFVGHLSAGSIFVICLAICHRVRRADSNWEQTEKSRAYVIWAVTGAAVLISALGFAPAGLYESGYRPAIGWWVLGISAAAMALRYQVFAIYLVASVIAWQYALHGSPNLWDYLLDPWLTIGCLGAVIGMTIPRRGATSSQVESAA